MGYRRRHNTTFFIVSVFAVAVAIVLSVVFGVDKQFSNIDDQIYTSGVAPKTLQITSSEQTVEIKQKDNLATNYIAAYNSQDDKLNWYSIQTSNGGLQTYDLKSDSEGNSYSLVSFAGDSLTAYNSTITDSNVKQSTVSRTTTSGMKRYLYRNDYFNDNLKFFLEINPHVEETTTTSDVDNATFPRDQVDSEPFTVLYTGNIKPSANIDIVFKTASDDSSLVFLSDSGNIMKEISEFDITSIARGTSQGILKVNNKGTHDSTQTQSSDSISLIANKEYQLVIIFGNSDGLNYTLNYSATVDGGADIDGFTNSQINYFNYYSNCMALIKYSVNGEIDWISETNASGSYLIPQELSIDSANNIYVTGVYDGVLTFSSSPNMNESRTITDTDQSSFVGKYNSKGRILWANSQNFNRVSVSHSESKSTTVVGIITGNDDTDIIAKSSYGGDKQESNSGDVAKHLLGIVRYNKHTGVIENSGESPNVLSTHTFNTIRATDKNIMCVKYSGTLTEEEPQVDNIAGDADNKYMLTRFDDTGEPHLDLSWNIQLDGDDDTHPITIHADEYGDIYVGGNFDTSVEFKDSSGTSRATLSGTGVNGFVANYTSSGRFKAAAKVESLTESESITIVSKMNQAYLVNGSNVSKINFETKSEEKVMRDIA